MNKHLARLVVVVAAGLAAPVACNENFPRPPTPPPPTTTPLTAPQSFNVQGSLQLRSPNGAISHDLLTMNQESFTLRVDPAGAIVIMGASRTAIAIPVSSDDGI